MSMSLGEQVAWITGGGSGIGQAGALALADAGATIVVSGRSGDHLRNTEAKVRAAGGVCYIHELDVTDVNAVRRVANDIVENFGRIDILVNSAGINVAKRHWDELTAGQWKELVHTNLDGAFYCTHAALPFMRKEKNGLVIYIASLGARTPNYAAGPGYNSSKAGILSMNSSINLELGSIGIRSCAICPGEVSTPMKDKLPVSPSDEEKALMLQADDIGRVIRFVAELPARMCCSEIFVSPTNSRRRERSLWLG